MEKFALDFDDAYHYTAAETYELTLVSFDSDFDRTERGRLNKTNGVVEFLTHLTHHKCTGLHVQLTH
ncbi:MAG: hypothetical protein DRH15_04210 [Deltaproteobacteria bacterium]|nr:hypothetical protein [Deltaproteobacteria bacterium]RLB84870.1 MAG: hypothetical protein DRH15_04210 [Deltaproteobacteria bacterium]